MVRDGVPGVSLASRSQRSALRRCPDGLGSIYESA
jgi:hypothetical protein